jgi:hypothetical protein
MGQVDDEALEDGVPAIDDGRGLLGLGSVEQSRTRTDGWGDGAPVTVAGAISTPGL